MTVDGLAHEAWLQLWMQSHAMSEGSATLIAWPDGRSLIEQPAIVVAMFSLIGDEVAKEVESRWQAKTTTS